MCPDDALLSAYVDDEIPSPWKERVETHLRSCARCSEKMSALRSLDRSLLALDGEAEVMKLSLAKARIAASIDFSAARGRARPALAERLRQLWSRRIALPMPFLAAGLLAFVFLVGMSLGIFSPLSGAARTMASASKTTSPQAATLDMMIQYMRQSSIQPVMIEMPQESVFSQLGNPVIVPSPEPAILEATTTSYGGGSR